MKVRLWWLAGDAVAAGALYERAIKAFKDDGDYGLDYVRALQGWGSLEAQTRNSTKARYLYVESVRTAQMVIRLVFTFWWEIKDLFSVRCVFLNVFHCQNHYVHLRYSANPKFLDLTYGSCTLHLLYEVMDPKCVLISTPWYLLLLEILCHLGVMWTSLSYVLGVARENISNNNNFFLPQLCRERRMEWKSL